MADVSSPFVITPAARVQYSAVARMRRQMLANSLRSRRGRFEFAARLFGLGFLALIWIGASIGFGSMAWHVALGRDFAMLPLLLWPILVAWQIIPFMLAAFQETVDLSLLLRFPMSFAAYTFLHIVFGLLDLSTLLGAIALTGIWIGLEAAQPHLGLWITLTLALFAAFNFFLTQMIFAWIHRWLAQRRTRDLLGALIFLLFVGLSFLNPIYSRYLEVCAPASQSQHCHLPPVVERAQRLLPPALAAASLDEAASGHAAQAAGSLGGLLLCAAGAAFLLSLRLHAEYRGENLGEAPGISAPTRGLPPRTRDTAAGRKGEWQRSPHAGIFSGVLVKELRSLSRSNIMLFGLLVSPLMLLAMPVSILGGASAAAGFALPVGIAYGFLPLTRQICNSLGGEGTGIQLYFLSPTPLHTVMLGKNLLQAALLCVEVALTASIVLIRFGPPDKVLAVATFCWLLFALPAQVAIGNVLSLRMAYRMTLTRLSNEEGATGNGLLSLLGQLLIFGVGAAVYLPLAKVGDAAMAAPLFLLLAAGAILAWRRGLSGVDRLAADRREALIAAMARTK